MTVFRYSIQYMKEHLERRLKNSIQDFRPTDIKWVITVPAIWNDSAKKFMRQAAEQVSIHLHIVPIYHMSFKWRILL